MKPARATTVVAASSMGGLARTYRAKVFLFVLARGKHGATLEEMEVSLGMRGNTVRPRRVELEEKGYVEDSGMTRPTSSGRQAIVWRVPEPVAERAREILKRKGEYPC